MMNSLMVDNIVAAKRVTTSQHTKVIMQKHVNFTDVCFSRETSHYIVQNSIRPKLKILNSSLFI